MIRLGLPEGLASVPIKGTGARTGKSTSFRNAKTKNRSIRALVRALKGDLTDFSNDFN